MMARAALAIVAVSIAVLGCRIGTPEPAPPRVVEELGVSFTPSAEAPPGVMTADAAMQALELRGAAFGRPPDIVGYGMATCRVHRGCLYGAFREGPRAVWWIEWQDRGTGEPWGLFVVDAERGDTLGGYGEW